MERKDFFQFHQNSVVRNTYYALLARENRDRMMANARKYSDEKKFYVGCARLHSSALVTHLQIIKQYTKQY